MAADTFDPSGPAPPGSGLFGLDHTPERARVVVVPVPFAATVSYRGGAERGPDAVLAASKQVELFDMEVGRPYEHGIAMLPISSAVRAWHREARSDAERVLAAGGMVGDDPELGRALARVNALGEDVNRWVGDTVSAWMSRGKLVAVVGGDHSTPFGAIEACARLHPGVGILHVDAHADLRVAYEGFTWSHASIMHNVTTRLAGVSRLVQVGVRDFSEDELAVIRSSGGRIVTYFDAELARRLLDAEPWSRTVAEIVRELPEKVYVSFDIDGLDPALCPHTGTPVPGGLSFHQATALLHAVVDSGRRVVGVDVNEVAPGPQGDEWDGNVGARVLYKLISAMLASELERTF